MTHSSSSDKVGPSIQKISLELESDGIYVHKSLCFHRDQINITDNNIYAKDDQITRSGLLLLELEDSWWNPVYQLKRLKIFINHKKEVHRRISHESRYS